MVRTDTTKQSNSTMKGIGDDFFSQTKKKAAIALVKQKRIALH
jgi:hypothetical protein